MAARSRKKGGGGRVVDFTPSARKPKVVVTGASGVLGSRLVRALAARGDRDVVVFDLASASDAPADVAHRFVDLNLPYADGTLLKLFKEVRPDAVVHLAHLRSPSRDTTYAHELNSIGTLHVLAAAGEAGVSRVVLGSTTLVYGARGDNPNFLTEDHPPRPDAGDAFVRDFVEAEQHARAHAKRYPSCRLAILRFAPLLAPEIRDFRTRYFEAPAAVTLLGYDPLLQFLDPEDAVEALLAALEKPDTRGVFNVAPDGVIPLSTVLMLYGTLAVPVPHPLAYPLVEAAWLSGISVMPGIHAHYLRYLCVADNEKARQSLGVTPKRTSLDNVVRTAKARRGRGRILDFAKVEEAVKTADYKLRRRLGRKAASGAAGATASVPMVAS